MSSPLKNVETEWLSKRKRSAKAEDEATEVIELSDDAPDAQLTVEIDGKKGLPAPSAPPKKHEVNEKESWKILKGKFMLGIYLCDVDWKRLYWNKQKVIRGENGRFNIGFEMCEECAWVNCRSADLMAPPKKK